jgi:CubicO group peptidase (beta-lactamase class C family)
MSNCAESTCELVLMSRLLTNLTLLAAGCCLLLSPAGLGAQDTSAGAIIARIEARQIPDRRGFDGLTLQEVIQRFRLPAMSVAVIKDFKIHWAKAYGIADVETGQQADTATLFQAGSISKPVFAMVAVKLAHAGRFSLDADVNSLLRSWRVPETEFTRRQPVTLRSLLSHTSGADDGFGFPGYDPGHPHPTLAQIARGERPSNTGVVQFGRVPYTGFKYSGGGYALAQLTVEDVMRRPLAALARDELFGPLALLSTTFEQPLPASFTVRAARGHTGAGRRQPAPWHDYPEQSAAGLWSTPSDVARLVIELQRAIRGPKGAVLSQATAMELLTPTGVGGHGQGFVIERRGEGWYFTHSGSNWNFRADLVAHVRNGYGVVIMTNSENGWGVITELEARIAAAYNWDALDKPIPR